MEHIPAPETPTSIWNLPSHQFSIEYGEGVLEKLRSLVQSGIFDTTQERCLLYGSRTDAAVVVTAASAPSGPEEVPTQATRVGWYRFSHHKDIQLTREDLKYFDSEFAEPGSLALVLRRSADSSIRIGVFFRETGGAVRWQSSYQEMVVAPPAGTVLVGLPTVAKTKSSRSWKTAAATIAVGVGLGSLLLLRRPPPEPVNQAAPAPIPVAARASSADLALAPTASKLAEEKAKLEAELKARAAHDRRMEAFVKLMRERTERQPIEPVQSKPPAQRSARL